MSALSSDRVSARERFFALALALAGTIIYERFRGLSSFRNEGKCFALVVGEPCQIFERLSP